MKTSIFGAIIAIVIFIVVQMVLPFPYGVILGIISCVLIIRYSFKHDSLNKDSLLKFRRVDPITEKERAQNEEAQRILEKKYIEDKIPKEDYKKRKKEFEDTEDEIMKCKVCGSEEFEFVLDEHVEEYNEYAHDVGHYECKRCGKK